jgi:hypothetical protein
MTEENGPQGARQSRSSRIFGRKSPEYSTRNALFAILAVVAMVATVGVAALGTGHVSTQKWSAINLTFGSNPVTNNLVIQFGRVSYIDQPTEYNTSGFVGATLTGNGAFATNSSGYGIYQFNSTTGAVASANYAVAASLGSNVSYFFTDQRVALNGTGGTWTYEISEAAQTSSPPTSGNVSNGAAAAAQNTLWIKSAYSAGNYTFTVGDWEEKPGGFQTYTTASLPATAKIQRLQFVELYVYIQKTTTIVSLVNTTNSAVLGAVTVNPVLEGNLSKIADITDQITMASSTSTAMIIDNTFMVDHNAFASVPAAKFAFQPLAIGTLSQEAGTPFDPATVGQKVNYTHPPTGVRSFSSVNGSLSAFGTIVNSSSAASEMSSALNTSLIVNTSSKLSVASAKQSLTTLRGAPEAPLKAATATLYVSTWTPASLYAQITNFLTGYISSGTGIPSADVEIQGYVITNVTVQTTLSTQAGKTVHDYLASAIPGMLATSHLALVNSATGAVEAGADVGNFLSPSGKVYVPHATMAFGATNPTLFDPVNGQTYASAEAAGFPVGSTITASGAVFVPYQAAFLGFSASGVPEFGVGGCFIVCLPSLSGAASAVSNFIGSAASTVSNAVGTVTNTVSQDVIQPVASTLSTDLSTFAANVSAAASNVMPFLGGTAADISSSITSGLGGIGGTLGNVGSTIASGLSGGAGAVLSGVNSFGNNIYHLGAAVGSAASTTGLGIWGGATRFVNSVGTAVGAAAGVISPWFAQAGNAVVGGLTSAGRSLASLGSTIANAGMGALETVGHAITGAVGGAWSWLQNGFGALGADVVNGLKSVFGALNPFNWLTGLGGSVSTLVIVVVIIVIVAITILVLFLVLRRHRRHKSGNQLGAKSADGGSKPSRFHHHSGRAKIGGRRGARA